MYESDENSNSVLIAFLTYGAALLTALGLNKIVPSVIDWVKEVRISRQNKQALKYQETLKLHERIKHLEDELDKSKEYIIKSNATLTTILPILMEMNKDNPNSYMLLYQIQKNIFGDLDIEELKKNKDE